MTFWSSHWAELNSLSGGPAPHSFKGFARHTDPNPAECGGTWTTSPGNSSHPPDDVPHLITAIASSSITQSGSTITGTTEISLDGTAYTIAALRALTPKQIVDLGTLSRIVER